MVISAEKFPQMAQAVQEKFGVEQTV